MANKLNKNNFINSDYGFKFANNAGFGHSSGALGAFVGTGQDTQMLD